MNWNQALGIRHGVQTWGDQHKVYAPINLLRLDIDSGVLRGSVGTEHGFVTVYMASNLERTIWNLHLDFIWEGRRHSVGIAAHYSEQYIVTLAARFARAVVEGSGYR